MATASASPAPLRPRVGVGFIIWRSNPGAPGDAAGAGAPTTADPPSDRRLPTADDEVLVGVRRGSHGAGMAALVGGWLEWGEQVWECAVREAAEEAGLAASDLLAVHAAAVPPAANLLREATGGAPPALTTHSITVFAAARAGGDAKPRAMEPHKCLGWRWVRLGALARVARGDTPVSDVFSDCVGLFPSLAALCDFLVPPAT